MDDTYLSLLPSEILTEVLAYLNYEELDNLRQVFTIIQTDKFWMWKLYQEYPNFKLRNITDRPVVIRGINTPDGLKIVINPIINPIIRDRRQIKRGLSCNTYSIYTLIEMIRFLQIPIPNMNTNLHEAMYYLRINNFDDADIIFNVRNRVLHFFNILKSKITKDQLCQLILNHLIINNLII